VTLRDRLAEELKSAMKNRDELRLATVRQVRSVIRNREIETRGDLDDQGIGEVLTSLAKQRRESIRMFQEAGRTDLVEKETRELAILQEFLPSQLSTAEVAALVARAIAESGARDLKEIGKVMKVLMPSVAGRADGKLVNEIVREQLAQG
jgi:uncharacterized protein YqeY